MPVTSVWIFVTGCLSAWASRMVPYMLVVFTRGRS